jgi:alanine racemase
MIQEAQLTIDLNSLAHNYNCLRSKLKKETDLIAVVKANAYGSDSSRIAHELVKLGVKHFAVAYTQEGLTLRNAGINDAIIVFYPQLAQLEQIIEHKLEPVLYNPEIIEAFVSLLKQKNLNAYPVHIKCNTGLNRIGLSHEEVVSFFRDKPLLSHLDIKSVYSHLGASENPKPCTFTNQQIGAFEAIKSSVKKYYPNATKFHLLNSSGVFNYPEYQLNAVRTGIGLYGFANNPEWDKELKPIVKLSAPICQIHSLKKGESVGYNQGWIAPGDSRIGVIPLGHADGIGRHYGNGVGKVQIFGHTAPIIGNVCMDMLMIDLGSIPCSIGTEVVLFDENHTAVEFTSVSNTITYEILTGLNPRIKRVYI